MAQNNNFQNPANPYLQNQNSQNAMPQNYSNNPQNQQQPYMNNGMPVQPQPQVQGQPISVGTPEAPVTVQSEAAPQAPEYGGEAIQRIERQAERAPERQEAKQPPQQSMPAAAPKQPVPQPRQPDAPSFFGYKVPPQLLANPKAILEQSGKGSSKEARTWLLVFLERMLRKQSEK